MVICMFLNTLLDTWINGIKITFHIKTFYKCHFMKVSHGYEKKQET